MAKPTAYDLTDAEKRDLTQLIQAGKPLPDKYRFILFEDKREVELVWNGKNRDVCTTVLPFQTLEHVDEPRAETRVQHELFDARGRQSKGWTNKLIWGDNKLILSSLKAGALRRQIEEAGGLKLIYIDPPFDVGADFSMDIEIGGETFHKEPNLLEQIAYRDTWGRGADSFISMIYERLILMRDLLADDGSIYVHCDYRVNSYLRLAMDEIFGRDRFRNEIIWTYSGGAIPVDDLPRKHDTLFKYRKTDTHIFNTQYRPYNELTAKRMQSIHKGVMVDVERGTPVTDWWTDIKVPTGPANKEKLGYPTQKPEALLDRIIKISTNEGDLVADFFAGSGTAAAVAEKLGRKWIATDLGKFAIHTTRKRLIGVQRELQAADKPFRAFEVLNLGRYERQAYLNVGGRLSGAQKEQALAEKEREFRELILRAYKAEAFDGDAFFDVIMEMRKRGATRVDVLAFEFEMGLFPAVLDEAKGKGIDLTPKYIPADVFDKRAVDRGQVVFHDISFVDATPRYAKGRTAHDKLTLQIELTDFSVYYSQGAAEAAIAALGTGKSEVICDRGQLVKVSKDKDSTVTRETLTKTWTDWVDYWAVDFDYESRREIIKVPVNADSGGVLPGFELPQGALPIDFEERWTGGYIFENEWQSFRTRKNRNLDLITAEHTYERAGRYTVAVKVVDIFGNDTMTLVPVNVG
jgi:DNA modification methylase